MILLFPGQGSQQTGMGKFLFEEFKIARETFEEASEALRLDLKKLCFEGSKEDLSLTENTQPALLVTSVATARVLGSVLPIQDKLEALAGHSIGEYAALVTAQVLPFAVAVKAVRIRGQAMQSAVPVGDGGMIAALGLEPYQVEEICQHANEKHPELGLIRPANFNCPGQIVISGSQKLLDWVRADMKAETVFGEAGPHKLKFIPLQVSAPFHSPLMEPAEKKMREVLEDIEFKNSTLPVLQNFTAKPHFSAAELRENLIRQVSAPVLWMQTFQNYLGKNAERPIVAIECGSGTVLKGLLKKIDSEAFQVFNTQNLEEIKQLEKIYV